MKKFETTENAERNKLSNRQDAGNFKAIIEPPRPPREASINTIQAAKSAFSVSDFPP
jgi:hypothetical protein